MADNRKAVREAWQIYQRREGFDAHKKDEAVRLLAGHGIWSLAHIAAIVGVSRDFVRTRYDKSDHTGGRFNPETLDLILEEFELKDRNESNEFLTARIIELGTSSGLLAKLIGQPWSTVKWRAGKAKAVAA